MPPAALSQMAQAKDEIEGRRVSLGARAVKLLSCVCVWQSLFMPYPPAGRKCLSEKPRRPECSGEIRDCIAA